MKSTYTALVLGLGLAMASPLTADTLDGLWQTDGYGLIAEFRGTRVRLYHTAGSICVPDPDGWSRIRNTLGEITISVAQDGASLLVAPPEETHQIRAHRLSTLPEACANPLPDTPSANFEALVAFFAQNYAFFDLYDIDWPRHVAPFRAAVHDDMSDAALFRLMADMLTPLADGHIGLSGRVGRHDMEFEPNPGQTHLRLIAGGAPRGLEPEDAIDAFHEAYWRGTVAQTILQGEGVRVANGRVQYGIAGDNVGYIALVTVADYGRHDYDPARDIAIIDDVMDEALTLFAAQGVEAVILDLSVNYGGFDSVSRAIAGRFASAPTLAYTKHAADALNPITTDVQIAPRPGQHFGGPVYVVTSDITVSGGEILTMALRALPNVTHVGEPTRGAFSDVLDRVLPNGWIVTLSNEVYRDHRGRLWEGRGLPPEIPLTIFGGPDPIAGHAAAIQTLLGRI